MAIAPLPEQLLFSKRHERRARQILTLLAISFLHGLLLLNLSRSVRPPNTAGDNSSNSIAMAVSLVAESVMEDPSSQGADQKTKALVAQAEPSPPADQMATEAEGAGTKAAELSGGSRVSTPSEAAPVQAAGGGGGMKDDPYARASLRSDINHANTFDLVARNDALFLSRVKPCLPENGAVPPNVIITVNLDDKGLVTSASPLHQGALATAPTTTEARVIAAVEACAPYRDIVLGRTPILKTPNSQVTLTQPVLRQGF